MKKISYFAAAAALLLMAGCSDEQRLSEGQGKVVLTTKVSTDMTVVSRSLEEDYASSTMIWISDLRGLIRRYDSLSELPTEPLVMRSGSYVAEAWCGDSVPASFDKRWFKASVPFTVTDGQTTEVPLTLKIANVAVSVKYGDNISEVLTDCKMTVGHTGGSLVYEGETASSRGFFMLPQASRDLNYKLEATQLNGTPFEYSGTIADTKASTEYVLNVIYNPDNTEMGAGWFTITIDEQDIPVQQEDVEIVTPPVFKGYGFDLSETITCEKGTVGRRCIYVSSASKIEELLIVSDDFNSLISGNDVEILGMDSSVRTALENAGINYVDGYYNETDDNTLLQINFEETFTNALEDGEHTFSFTAKDREGRTSTATMTINISDAPVTTNELAATDLGIYTNRATVGGTIVKEGATEYGIKYRKSGSAWTTVASTATSGSYTVELTGLTAGTTYEYCAYADSFEGQTYSFTTETAAQLPNSGFEDWQTSSTPYLIYADGDDMFWDSGNHGSSTMKKNITTPDSDVKHGGNYSAKLASQFVGIGTIGKFAAGNVFAGKYLATSGTDGILGWGREFTSRPTAVKVWVKYTPATVGYGDTYKIASGDMDQGIIYAALTDATTQSYDGEEWSQVVKTKSSERQLFDQNDDKVIAYGEYVFETATDGDDMVQITIPLDYKRTDSRPTYIIFVCSSSRYGDYFNGGAGSTMWVDDIELVYE